MKTFLDPSGLMTLFSESLQNPEASGSVHCEQRGHPVCGITEEAIPRKVCVVILPLIRSCWAVPDAAMLDQWF